MGCGGVECSFFLPCLAAVGRVLPKMFPVVNSPFFPRPLARGNRLFLELVWSVPPGDYELEVFAVLCPRYMGVNKQTQGTHHHVIPQVPKL